MACAISCELNDLNTRTNCNDAGGIKVAYWVIDESIDWTATAADPLEWDPTSETILGFTMAGGAVWNKIQFERKGSNYTQSFTLDADTYAVLITMLFNGKDQSRRNALCKAIKCCKIVIYVIGNDCTERLFGKEWDGDLFQDPVVVLEISQHDDNSGDKGGDKATDTVIIGGEQDCPALFGDIGQTTFESTYL